MLEFEPDQPPPFNRVKGYRLAETAIDNPTLYGEKAATGLLERLVAQRLHDVKVVQKPPATETKK